MRFCTITHTALPQLAAVALVCVLICGGGAYHVRAQEPTPNATAEPTPSTIRGVQIAERAQQTDGELRAIRARLAPDANITAIEESLPALTAQIERLRHDAIAQLGSAVTLQALDELALQWQQFKSQLAKSAQALASRAQMLEQDASRLSELEEVWTKTEAGARADALPEALRKPIRTTLAGIRDVQTQLRRQRDALLATLGRVTDLQTHVAENLDELALAEQAIRRDVFVADSPPLWVALRDWQRTGVVKEAFGAGRIRNWTALRVYVSQQWQRFAVQGLLLVAMLAVTITLARRHRAAAEEKTTAVRVVVERPISSALVLTLLLTSVLHPYAPFILSDVTALVAIVPIMRLFRDTARREIRIALLTLTVLLVFSTLRRLLPPFSPPARLLMLGENVLMMTWVLVTFRNARFGAFGLSDLWRRGLASTAWVILAVVTLAIAANLAGNVSLCIILTHGILVSALSGVGLLTGERVIEGLLVEIIVSRTAQRLRCVANRSSELRSRATRIVRVVMVVAWLLTALSEFGLLAPVLKAFSATLAAPLTIGTFSESLGSILAVLLILWASFTLARVVRIVLEEEALSRLALPRGVPAAISAGANYIIVLLGVLLALSAAGIDPGRIALVAGALSVGIGFGLQTVVNNFVSGLILLFERPIQIGDVIGLADVTGTVRRIGIRSSTIATFDGSEVIVPNATLIAERVVNWTLSSRQRRIEIKVGVAYGSDLTQVLSVLEGAVKDIPEVLAFPSPRALFVGFGDSSLDFILWVWTDRQDILAAVRSRVGVAVHDALREAQINIPFPQRDLHITPDYLPPRS
jgi:potassium efflux system protein